MAARGATPRGSRGGATRAGASGRGAGRTPGRAASTPGAARPRRDAPPAPPTPAPPVGTLRLGAAAGTTPGRWIDTWRERMPHNDLELVPLALAHQRNALTDGEVDAALVRMPVDRSGLHVIALYDEVSVVVCAADSHLTAADELTTADLVGEVVIVPADAAVTVDVEGSVAPAFAPPRTTEEAIATVAAGVGVVIVPMSLARLHHRKDAEYRPLTDAPTSTVALAWPSERGSALVDAFIGIVRGRTANSSRD